MSDVRVFKMQLFYKDREVQLINFLADGIVEVAPLDDPDHSILIDEQQLEVRQTRLCSICYEKSAESKDGLCQDCRDWEEYKNQDWLDEQTDNAAMRRGG